jgi:hypothetical protein
VSQGSAAGRSGPGRRVGPVLLLGAATAVAWAASDLVRPRQVDIRSFDPDEVARLETAMWRSYYDRRRLPLFTQLVSLMRQQFQLPPSRAILLAGLATRAAIVFQGGRERADYVRALPLLRRYYAVLRQSSEVAFDPDRASVLELEWWIVHRDAARLPAGSLERSLADISAELYQVPAGRLDEHADHRAEAMTIRDRKAAAGEVSEQDWQRIEEELRTSWRALRAAV